MEVIVLNNNMIFIIVFTVLSIIFLFTAIIIVVRNKKSAIKKDRDLIDKFIDNKKNYLKSIPNAISFKAYMYMCIIIPLIVFTTLLLILNVFVATISAIISFFIPEIYVRMTENKQKKQFDERYARALRQISSSLKAGMTIQQAVDDLCTSPFIHYEIRNEFSKINSDIKLGISVSEAFSNMADRIPTDDVKDVAAAIKMQSIVGGSEAESIETISKNISSRIMVRKEIKALFAGVKMTILGMDIIPILSLAFIYFGSPSYFNTIFKSTLGILIIFIALIMMIFGSYINRKLLSKTKRKF